MQKDNMITTHYEVDPAMACGGVYVDGKGFVEVTPGEIHDEPENGLSLWEYTDEQGDVRACMLRVKDGRTSPSWHIKPNAGDGENYYELHRAVNGLGSMAVRRAGELRYDVALPHIANEPLRVEPGDVFNITSEQTPPGKAPFATYVLATFPGAPFKLEYEERI
jgi:hypothetical protein